jgi:hypothetical protein
MFIIFKTLFLSIVLHAAYCSAEATSRNEEILFVNSSKLSSTTCYNTIQSLRAAYYKNSGEYVCVDADANKRDVQCLEATNNFDVLFGTFNAPSSAVGYSSACVDFNTGEYYCYDPNYSGISLGLGLFWADTKGVACPDSLISMKSDFQNLCAPALNIILGIW